MDMNARNQYLKILQEKYFMAKSRKKDREKGTEFCHLFRYIFLTHQYVVICTLDSRELIRELCSLSMVLTIRSRKGSVPVLPGDGIYSIGQTEAIA